MALGKSRRVFVAAAVGCHYRFSGQLIKRGLNWVGRYFLLCSPTLGLSTYPFPSSLSQCPFTTPAHNNKCNNAHNDEKCTREVQIEKERNEHNKEQEDNPALAKPGYHPSVHTTLVRCWFALFFCSNGKSGTNPKRKRHPSEEHFNKTVMSVRLFFFQLDCQQRRMEGRKKENESTNETHN